jgi:hypothetical protein
VQPHDDQPTQLILTRSRSHDQQSLARYRTNGYDLADRLLEHDVDGIDVLK